MTSRAQDGQGRAPATGRAAPLLEARGLTVRFGKVTALGFSGERTPSTPPENTNGTRATIFSSGSPVRAAIKRERHSIK